MNNRKTEKAFHSWNRKIEKGEKKEEERETDEESNKEHHKKRKEGKGER